MLFNSIDFAIFLPIVFWLYWFVFNSSLKLQNFFIWIVSYIFYGWWDWHFLGLLAFSSLVDFFVGIFLQNENNLKKRKLYLTLSILINLGLLGFFKYHHFFVQNFVNAFTLLGFSLQITTLNLILPVGISFYTFQTLSYTIDVYQRKMTATRDIVAFFSYISFFPQLVAGPIERATHLLPQFFKKRVFSELEAADGLRQILWGLFKKIVIADNCAIFVNEAFNYPEIYDGFSLFLGAIFFAFQIYGDFSGYSDIAIGTAKLFGFNLMQNFAYPYFSRDIAEFWRRWHISLSTWFRDYVYIPLGGSKGTRWQNVRNIWVIFLLSGFWHGAGWSFLVWGGLNAVYFMPLFLLGQNRKNLVVVAQDRTLPSLKELWQIGFTFLLTTFAWIFFRAYGLMHAFTYLKSIFANSQSEKLEIPNSELIGSLIVLLLIFEWVQRGAKHGLALKNTIRARCVRWLIYLFLIFLIAIFGSKPQDFIYFQF